MTAEEQLLAAVEALMLEVKGLRTDLAEARESTKTLQDQREKKAATQARWRAKAKEEPVESTKSLHVESTKTTHVQVLKALKQDLKATTCAVDTTKTLQTPTGEVWASYSKAYFERYGTEPVRNSRVNGQLAQLVKRLGAEEAPQVAEFYVSHRKAFYVENKHPVGFLLRDCEGLRTEWAKPSAMGTGPPMGGVANGAAFAKFLKPEVGRG